MKPLTTGRTIRRITAVIVALFTFLSALPANAVTAFAAFAGNVFTFSESGITAGDVSGTGYTIEGTDLTIESAGTYKITGSCSEGTVSVKKGTAGVTLILENLTLSSSASAPLVIKKNADVVIDIEGTNTLTDLEDPAAEDSADAEIADAFEGAAIKVKSGSTVTFTGFGTLTADGSACKNGIKGASAAAVVVGASSSDSFTLNIKAANNGLASDGSVTVNGGNLVISSDGDGIKTAPEGDDADSAGVISITGGSITIDAAGDSIQSSIPDTEEISVAMASTVGTINISGGTINVTAGDDAVKADLDAIITGGTFMVNAADDGIKAEYVLTIGTAGAESGPSITVTKSSEGLEGATVNLYSGNADITSSDDGINAANGDLTGYSYSLNIYGGSWYINAGGDGLDSNGPINVCGGTTEVYGSADNGNGAVDSGDSYTWNHSGGTLLAVGMSGMAETPSSGNYVVFGSSAMGGMGGMFGGMTGGASSVSVSKGSSIVIKDSSGTTLYSATAVKNANHIVFASDDLTPGETLTLYVNNRSAATATVGTGGTQGGMQPGQPGQGGTQPGQPGQGGTQPGQPGQGGTQPGQPGQGGTQPGQHGQGGPLFSDVTDPSAWYYNAVRWAVETGTSTGYGDGTFRPESTCTRAEAVALLYKFAGSPDVSSYADPGFSDVTKSDWYYNAVKWAVANGITTGYGAGTFKPYESCSRAMIAAFLMHFAECRGLVTAASDAGFSDVSSGDWFYSAVNWAAANGVTSGYGEGTFQPYAACSRAMMVTFLQRMAGLTL